MFRRRQRHSEPVTFVRSTRGRDSALYLSAADLIEAIFTAADTLPADANAAFVLRDLATHLADYTLLYTQEND